MVLSIIDVIDI